MSWIRDTRIVLHTHMMPASLVVAENRKVPESTAPAREVGISHLNKVVAGSSATASTRRRWQRKLPHQSPERLGALECSDARTGLPANTLETRQVNGECSWQTSRVKLVLAALEFVSEAPR